MRWQILAVTLVGTIIVASPRLSTAGLHRLQEKIEAHRQLRMMCGPLSALRVAGLSGKEFDAQHVLRGYKSAHRGVSLREVVSVSRMLGLRPQAVRCAQHDLSSLPTPCILLIDEDRHCVVLESTSRGTNVAKVWDPSIMKTKLVGLRGLADLWSRKAIIFSPPPIDRFLDLTLGVTAICGLLWLVLRCVNHGDKSLERSGK